MSQNNNSKSFDELADAIEGGVTLDVDVVFGVLNEMDADPLFMKSDELYGLECELAVAEKALASFGHLCQQIVDLALRKVHLETTARTLLLEKKGVASINDLPRVIGDLVEKYRQQILSLDTNYQNTCKELAALRQELELSEFNAHLTAKVNIEAAISAIIKEANNG